MEFSHILAATDLSPDGDEVIRQADHIARSRGAQLTVFHATPTPTRAAPFFPQSSAAIGEDFVSLERQVLERLVEGAVELPRRATGGFRIGLAWGAPDEEIISYANTHGVDLIAVGGGGPPPVARELWGSVAEKV